MQQKSNKVRRSQIQKALAPAIQNALDGLIDLDLNREEDRRRLMRAAVHTVAGMLLEKGEHPNNLAVACMEAIHRELHDQAAQHAQDGTFAQAAAEA